MYTIEESIKTYQENIAKEEKKIKLLKSLQNNELNFTEENYHELCLSTIRGSRLLGEKIVEIFPFLKLSDSKYFINNYVFYLEINGKEYKILIPCSAIKNISIVIPKIFTSISFNSKELDFINRDLEKINTILNEKSVFARANISMAHYKKPFRLLAYLINFKCKKNYIKKYTRVKEDMERTKQLYIKTLDREQEKLKEYEETVKYFKEIIAPKFLQWTEEVHILEYPSCCANIEIIKR